MQQALFLLFITAFCLPLNAQQGNFLDSTPTHSFIKPMNIPFSLSGNFGELRPGHFHAGLDIRTQGKEGLPVVAIAHGFVSRIAVSLSGYGKVIYITHDNGYTSVYAHLQQFGSGIEKLVKDIQYQQNTFVFDTSLHHKNLRVAQGQVIGLSGNTGGSGGPHLHFEIRNTKSEKAINPLYFYPELLTDNIAPQIRTLSIYPLNLQSSVNGKHSPLHIKVSKHGPKYSLSEDVKIKVNGKIGFGIETRDHLNNSPFKMGAYAIGLKKNGKDVFTYKMDSLSFEHSRCINVHMDYYQAKKHKRKVERSFIHSGNRLQIYANLVNDGKLFFLQDSNYQMSYSVLDFNGNKSSLDFVVKGSSEVVRTPAPPKSFTALLKADQDNRYVSENVRIYWPQGSLYNDLEFEFSEKSKIGRCLTPRYQIHHLYEPLNDYMTLELNINYLPIGIQKKCVIVSLDEKSRVLAAEGGTVDSGWISVKTRSFGPYTVFVDSTPPSVKPINFYSGKTLNSSSVIRFSIKDNIAGVKQYHAYVDDEWVLLEYQRNKKIAFIRLSDVDKKNHERHLQLRIADGVGNIRKLDYRFHY